MPAESHHVFVSYAREDNLPRRGSSGAITNFILRLRREYFALTRCELRVFFDQEDIEGMDHWQHKILSRLSASYILLACISPAYLRSEWCQREFNEYRKGELRRGVAGAGIAPVYVFEVPEWSDGRKSQQTPEWVRNLRDRQFFDLRSYFLGETEGNNTVPKQFKRLGHRLEEQISRSERSERSPGFIDPHNYRFVGRESEMEWLKRRLVSPESSGDLVVLHGLGGMGKTSLAVEYAHSFAHEYVAGRWQAKCGRGKSLSEAIARIAPELGIEFQSTEPADWEYRARRVLGELQKRAIAGANGTQKRCLLILDNVDDASLTALSRRHLVPRAGWLHTITTSQFGPSDAPDIEQDAWLSVDRFSEDDAVRILEQFQPGGSFADAATEQLARKIASYLGGFTMALECAGIFLGRFPNDGLRLLEEIEFEGLTGFEAVADRSKKKLFLHDEKKLTATLGPVLERLKPDELLTLQFAAVMPPESVTWEWIEYLVGDRFPDVEKAEQVGEVGRWTLIQEHLQDLRLVTGSSEPWAGRIHSLVQEVIALSYGFHGQELKKRLIDYSFRRYSAIEHDWENRAGDWELEALRRWAAHLMERDPSGGGSLEARLADLLRRRGRYREEEPLRRHVLKIREELFGPESEETILAVHKLGSVLSDLDQLAESEDLFRRALLYCTRERGDLDATTNSYMRDLGLVILRRGHLKRAEPLLRRALADCKRFVDSEHLLTLNAENDLAMLLKEKGDRKECESLFRHALSGKERLLSEDDDSRLRTMGNLAGLLLEDGNYVEAEPLLSDVTRARERIFGSEHPSTLLSLNNLAICLHRSEKYDEAETCYRQALVTSERILGSLNTMTLGLANGLAALLGAKGDYEQAERLFCRVIEGQTQVLGAQHRETLQSMNNLAAMLVRKGDLARAEPLQYRVYEGRVRMFGPASPKTLSALDELAASLVAREGYREAEILYRQAFTATARARGPEDPLAITWLSHVGSMLNMLGERESAELVNRQALQSAESVLGPEDPWTLSVMNGLAFSLRRVGKDDEAQRLYQRALETSRRVLGSGHSLTMAILNNVTTRSKGTGKLSSFNTDERRRQ